MHCGTKGTARRGDGAPIPVFERHCALVDRWPERPHRCAVSGRHRLLARLVALARRSGERIPLLDDTVAQQAANAATLWAADDHPGYLGLAWSGRYAALGVVDADNGPCLRVSVWTPTGTPCRRLDLPIDDLEVALIELEAQGDLPAVLIHPLVVDLV